jgi:hypothetical protein
MRRPLVGAAAALALLAGSTLSAQCHEPGADRWPIKSSLPASADLGAPRTVALTTLLHLPNVAGVRQNDARYASVRIPQAADSGLHDGDIVTTTGYLRLVATDDNSCEYLFQLSQQPVDTDVLIVAVPKDDEISVADSALRARAATIRTWVRARLLGGGEPSPRGNVMQHSVYVRVTGQLFYDDANIGQPPGGRKGMIAPGLWEIRPATSIEFSMPPAM